MSPDPIVRGWRPQDHKFMLFPAIGKFLEYNCASYFLSFIKCPELVGEANGVSFFEFFISFQSQILLIRGLQKDLVQESRTFLSQ